MRQSFTRDNLSRQLRTSCQVPLFPEVAILSGMRKASTPASFRKNFIGRVKAARLMCNKSPDEVAKYLDIPRDTYIRYEKRALLPHHLIAPFCEATHMDVYKLLTGRAFDLGEAIAFMGKTASN